MIKMSTGQWKQGPVAFGWFLGEIGQSLERVGAVITGVTYTTTGSSNNAGYCLTIDVGSPDIDKMIRDAHDKYA